MGIAADTLWAVALFVPPIFGRLVGISNFAPDLQFKLTMAVGGTLMTGWIFLLLWAVRKPVQRRFVILLTAIPVVLGLSIVSLVGVMEGNTFQIWILIKNSVLFVAMISSYILAGKLAKEAADHQPCEAC